MARYERDYGRDYGRWRQQGPPTGGMRSDGWGGTTDWRQFAGEEGWYGEGYEGMPGFSYDLDIRGQERSSRSSGWNLGGGYGGRWGAPGSPGGMGERGFRREEPRSFGRGGPRGYGAENLRGFGREETGGFGREESRGYGREFRARPQSYAGRTWDTGQPGGGTGYAEGWEDSWTRERSAAGSFGRGMMRAADLMTESPQAVTPTATLTDVARKMRDLDVGIIPVVDNEDNRRLRGVITDRDIAIRAIAEGKNGNIKVSECMTSQVRSVNKNDSVQDVMRIMRQDQVRRVPVTDREGRLVGIIAQADLAVDYGPDDWNREREVEETLERISRPAEPQQRGERGGQTQRGSQSQRGSSQGGRQSQRGGESQQGNQDRNAAGEARSETAGARATARSRSAGRSRASGNRESENRETRNSQDESGEAGNR